MIELQVLNKLIKDKSTMLVRQHGIGVEHFITYKTEVEFLFDHYEKYGTIPDRETVADKFNDFQFIDVNETDKYLIERLQEQYTYSMMVPVVHKIAELVQTDANSAAVYARNAINEVFQSVGQYKTGYDLIRNAKDRAIEYQHRLDVKGLLGISSGVEPLDNILHGWLDEDLIAIIGRPNQGKSWLLQFFLMIAWRSGKRVLMYSGEMSKMIVGFRFDTLNANFSNLALMCGVPNIGTIQDPKDMQHYEEYTNNLSAGEVPFIVVTPRDLGGNRLDIPTLHGLIEVHKPDIIGIDQVSLMDDYRSKRNDNDATRIMRVSQDLYVTSEKYGIPILAPGQALKSKERGKKSKKGDEQPPPQQNVEMDTPELEDAYGSDGLPQNATRVLTIRQHDVTLKISVKKNRYGVNNQDVLLLWDIDKGIMKPFLKVDNNNNDTASGIGNVGAGEELF